MLLPPQGQPPAPQESALDHRLKELGIAVWAITLIGSASLTAFLATLFEGPGKADVAGAMTFASAAFGGLALTLGAAFASAALRRGTYQGHAAGTVATLCMAAGIAVANLIGVGTVGWDVVQGQLAGSGGAPILKAFALVGACLIVYGFIPGLQAIVCGLLLGHWLDLLRD